MIDIKKIEGKNIYIFETIEIINDFEAENYLRFIEGLGSSDYKIKVVGILESFPKFENFMILLELLKEKIKPINLISNYAIVTDKTWLENAIPIGDYFTSNIEIKQFDLDKKEEAIQWLEKN